MWLVQPRLSTEETPTTIFIVGWQRDWSMSSRSGDPRKQFFSRNVTHIMLQAYCSWEIFSIFYSSVTDLGMAVQIKKECLHRSIYTLVHFYHHMQDFFNFSHVTATFSVSFKLFHSRQGIPFGLLHQQLSWKKNEYMDRGKNRWMGCKETGSFKAKLALREIFEHIYTRTPLRTFYGSGVRFPRGIHMRQPTKFLCELRFCPLLMNDRLDVSELFFEGP